MTEGAGDQGFAGKAKDAVDKVGEVTKDLIDKAGPAVEKAKGAAEPALDKAGKAAGGLLGKAKGMFKKDAGGDAGASS